MCHPTPGLLLSLLFARPAGPVRWALRLFPRRAKSSTARLSFRDFPVMPFALPAGLLPDGRATAVRLHRPTGRPILLLNVYLPAASEARAAALLDDVFRYVAGQGDEALLLGDFNLPPDRAPVVDARAVGAWRLAEETILGDAPLPPTRRDDRGRPTGRCIDYALSTAGVPALDRRQTPGPADHDLISYTFSLARDQRELPCAPLRRACDGSGLGSCLGCPCC